MRGGSVVLVRLLDSVCVFVCVCLNFGLLSSRLFFDPLPAPPPPPLAPSHAEHSMQEEIM